MAHYDNGKRAELVANLDALIAESRLLRAKADAKPVAKLSAQMDPAAKGAIQGAAHYLWRRFH